MAEGYRNRSGRRQSGFTLLEVLVAFVVLAAVLGVVMRLNAQALSISQRAGERQQALLLAQSQLDRVLARPELQPGREEGRLESDTGYRWIVEVTPFEFEQQRDAVLESRIQPWRIDVRIYREAGPEVRLTTLRLGIRP
ncbi:type IV pilus modification PilV family protein [Marinobacterium weihaiense]|uniref:Prepilin-type N-terminal cleavage/methylation domain-containing protein n=1 Tax=Marinobacterium weihaiense TaxID=2851016 RepID=A0ABS6MD92_9GAMM|nr:prepilin-type N-terminal cleavage/methylation domain-containing protein [Marinobacterium weihaiense]MBV0934273.1 prepilin-type N-terminal cleavage/methylation domain-containing protein [Marinobacterium weihaiense]